jgi:protein ImuA
MPKSSQSPPNALLLAELRQRIRHLETPQPWLSGDDHIASGSCPLGIDDIDQVLPGGGLYRGALHEIAASGIEADTKSGGYMDATATGFAAFLAARFAGNTGHVLWCRREGSKDSASRGRYGPNIYGPGLAALGLDTNRLIVARGLGREEVLWAMEEGLASRALCAVLGEPGHLDQTALRRLQLASESSLTPALLLMPEPALPAASPAHTRWRIKTLRARVSHHTFPASAPHWQVEMLKCRGVQMEEQSHEWTITRKKPDTGYGETIKPDHTEAHRFVVAAGLSRGSRPITQRSTSLIPFRRSA